MQYSDIYVKTKIYMVLIGLVLFGAINSGLSTLGYNVIELITKQLNLTYPIEKFLYILIALVALWLASKKTTWLPFLGYGLMPSYLVPLSKPKNTNTKVTIKTMPNAKIAYWSARTNDDKTPVEEAYDDLSNSGVVMSDADGNATLEFLESTGYTVPDGRVLPRHVHWRIVGLQYGLMGKVKTTKY
jgi:hypothetical protein